MTVVAKDVCGCFDSDKKENVRELVKEMESADGDNWWGKDLIVTRGKKLTNGALVRSVCERQPEPQY